VYGLIGELQDSRDDRGETAKQSCLVLHFNRLQQIHAFLHGIGPAESLNKLDYKDLLLGSLCTRGNIFDPI